MIDVLDILAAVRRAQPLTILGRRYVPSPGVDADVAEQRQIETRGGRIWRRTVWERATEWTPGPEENE